MSDEQDRNGRMDDGSTPDDGYDDDLDGLDEDGLTDLDEPRGPDVEFRETSPEDEELFREAGDAVYASLLARIGEASPQRRLTATRRALDLMGEPQRSYPIVHITGTNGKTSTSRIIASLLGAHGLRVGLFSSPHLVRFNERIAIDGESIRDEDLARLWQEVEPYLELVDSELEQQGELPLTFFEAMTVLAYATFADAPVDVAVIEVGMGGEWDSTNVGDGLVAVFTPVALDHQARLGNTIEEIAKTKSGIIKPAASVISSAQTPGALAVLREASAQNEATFAVEGEQFALVDATVGVGGQRIAVRGLDGSVYEELLLPLYGIHQAHNAATAIAAVEAFFGGKRLEPEVVADGIGAATSPGRLQVVGTAPTVLVDAAHNPAGIEALVVAVDTFFDFDEVAVVFGVLADKDVRGIAAALGGLRSLAVVFPTASDSPRAADAEEIDAIAAEALPGATVREPLPLREALADARAWAEEGEKRAVLVTGSITLVGDVLALVAEEDE